MNLVKNIRLKRLLKIVKRRTITGKSYKALISLGKTGDPAALDPLVEALRNNYTKYAITAAEALGELGDKRALPFLKNAVCSLESELRVKAASSLAKLGETDWQSHIQGNDDDFNYLAGQDDEQIIRNLCFASSGYRYTRDMQIIRDSLKRSNNPLLVKIAKELVTDPNGSSRPFFIQILGEKRDTSSAPLLIDLLKEDQQINIEGQIVNREEARYFRNTVIAALGKIGDAKSSVPELINFLADPDASIRKNAAHALEELGKPGWAGLVHGDNEDFKRMGETKDHFFLQPLISILTGHKCPEAAKGLGEMGSPEAIAPLRRSLLDHSDPLRKAAVEALSKLGEPYWKDYVRGDEEDFYRLCQSGKPEAIELLILYINDLYPDMYRELNPRYNQAVKTIEDLNNPELLDTMIKVLENTENSPLVRFQCVKALGRIGDPKAIDVLVESFSTLYYGHDVSDGVSRDRLHSDWEVIESLGKIGDRKAVPVFSEQLNKEKVSIAQHAVPFNKYKDSSHKLDYGSHYKIKDSEEKISRIIRAFGRIGGREVIGPLIELLDFWTFPIRELAAKSLISLAENDFTLVTQQWGNTRSKITSPHKDHEDGVNEHSISDCSHTDTFVHADVGIGLEIPPELDKKA
jgi:HEAT repeat protein